MHYASCILSTSMSIRQGGCMPASGGPLDGIRVLDLTSVVMGPLATQIFGDLGADVITVETRDGDINRVMGPGPHPGLSGVSLNLLRNKRNISLDIAHPDGRAALLRAAAGCYVFVTNLRPGSVGRLRLRYPDIAAIRPRSEEHTSELQSRVDLVC